MSEQQFRRGDTVSWPKANYLMYVTSVTPGGFVTTDAWASIDPAELTLVKPVEDKYDALMDVIGRALKERPQRP